MTNVYSIGSGRQNKMYCLYYTFMEYKSYGSFERTHHVANLSTSYDKAVAKAKSLYETYKTEYTKLVLNKKWDLDEIVRDGSSKKNNTFEFAPSVQEEVQVFPTSQKVGSEGEKLQLTLGVTDAFGFKSRFGYSRCIKFVDVDHNEYIIFSSSKLAYELSEGDTLHCEAVVKGYQSEKDYEKNVEVFTTILTKLKGSK